MGYGPVCAEHYGLAWGEQRADATNVATVNPELTNEQAQAVVAEHAHAAGMAAVAAAVARVEAEVAQATVMARSESSYGTSPTPVRHPTRSAEEIANEAILRQREIRRRRGMPERPAPRPAPAAPRVATPADPEDEDSHFM